MLVSSSRLVDSSQPMHARCRAFTTMLLLAGLLVSAPAIPQAVSISELLGDDRRELVVEVLIRADGSAELVRSFVSQGPPRAYIGDPPQMLMDWYDIEGNLLGSRGTWDPREGRVWDAEGKESRAVEAEASGPFGVLFDTDIARVRISDGETTDELLEVGVAATVDEFCALNPANPNCVGHTPNSRPTAVAGGPYSVEEGYITSLDGSASFDPDGNTLTYRWDLDGDGILGEVGADAANGNENGVAPTFIASGLTAPDSWTVQLEVCDGALACDQATAQINIIAVFDSDRDGIPDAEDNCPNRYNPGQEDVLNRGIGDACARMGDFDGDGDVDWLDVGIYLSPGILNTPAYVAGEGGYDRRPLDLNRDGTINILDARFAIQLCDLPGCEIIN